MCSVLFVVLLCFVSIKAGPIASNEKVSRCGVEVSNNALHRNPWTVFLDYHRSSLRCAGTLVSNNHVVTAAHCVQNYDQSKIKVRLGEYNETSSIDCADGLCADEPVLRDVAKIFVHENYSDFRNDIAVLRLAMPAPYTDFIKPVCLPSDLKLEEGMSFVASGWGEIKPGIYSDVKKHILLPYFPFTDCCNVYPGIISPHKVICAGGIKDFDTCVGDSGGPLTLDIGGRIELWGVTCGGKGKCGSEGYPGIYTNVKDNLKWLETIIRL